MSFLSDVVTGGTKEAALGEVGATGISRAPEGRLDLARGCVNRLPLLEAVRGLSAGYGSGQAESTR
jgi:hypothetical protein